MAEDRYDVIVVGCVARARRRRCCSRARATRSSSSTAPRSRATRCRRTSFTRRGGGTAAMGVGRWAHGDWMPSDRHVHLRLRPVHDLGRPGHRRFPGRVLPAADGARQAARRRGVGGGGRGPRGVHGRRRRHRRRPRRRHPRPQQRRRDRHRARRRRRRSGRAILARREGRRRRAVQREAADTVRLLHLLERLAHGRQVRGVRTPRGADGRRRPPTTA